MKFKNIVKIWITRFLISLSIPLLMSAKVWGQPTATINGTTTVCVDAPSPNITFIGANGTAPYTFNYTINSGTILSVNSSPTGNIATVPVPTGTAGVFTYTLISVSDATSPSNAQSGSAEVTVSSLPLPTITGHTTACQNSTGNIYTTESGMSNYTWLLTGGTITAGEGTSAITVTWNTPGGQSVSVNYNNANNCPAASATVYPVTVYPLPVPTITGSSTVCINSTGNIYTTESGMSSYTWSVNGGAITAGFGTRAITVTWNTLGAQSVSVNYNNANNCMATSATVHAVTVYPLPVPTITGSSAACMNSTGNIYTTESGMSGYTWTVTAGGTITAGSGTRAITVTWGTLGAQSVSVNYNNAANCTATSATVLPVTVYPLPVPTITGPATACLNSAGNIYTTETGMSSYTWSVTGGTIAAGSGTNAITVTWNTPGAQSVRVNYNNANNCTATSATVYAVTVDPSPVPTITGPAAVCINSTGNIYTTETAMTSYSWAVTGGTITGGIGTNAITVTWNTSGAQSIRVNYNNANNCPAASATVYAVTVDPLPVPTITGPVAVCINSTGNIYTTEAGMSNYLWSVTGGTITAGIATNAITVTWNTPGAQSVSVNYNNTNNCTATPATVHAVTVDLLPVPTLTSSDADNILCAGTSVIFTASGGTNYNFRVGGTSVQNGALTTYTTSSLTNGQVVDVVVSNTGGCSATSPGITNTVNPLPVSHGGSGGNVCSLSFRFNAVPSIGIGTWSETTGPGTASFSPNSNTANATVTVSEYGTYTFTWTEVSGQCSSSSIVTVNFYLLPIANAGIGGNNCGLGFHLNGTMNAGTGTWAKVSGPGNVTFTPNANTPNALATVSAFGSYTFSWTVVNGTCSNSANVNVVFVREIAANGGAGGDVCGEVFVLDATAPANGTGTWSKYSGPGNAVFTTDAHQPGATVTVDMFGIYEFAWTISSGTCTSADMVKVTFHDGPPINAGRDTAVCKGGSIRLEALGVGTVSWNPVQLLSNPNIINPIATPDSTTNFIVNLVDQFGCKNADTIKVEVRDNVVADAGPDQLLNYVFTTHLDAILAHSYEQGVWSIVSGTGEFTDSTDAKTVVSGLSLGITRLLWTVTNGVCPPSSDSANIIIKHFVIPTMITPNMDGRNDYFILSGVTNQNKTGLIIFDRRGVQVYKNTDYDNSWNGVDYNNNPLPDDTYFYIVKYADGTSYKGYIVIRK